MLAFFHFMKGKKKPQSSDSKGSNSHFGKVKSIMKKRIKMRHKKDHPEKSTNIVYKSLMIVSAIIGFFILASLIFVIVLYNIVPYNLDGLFQAQSTIIMDREGNELYRIHGEENRRKVPLSDIPQYLIDASIAIEDDEFYDHFGIDFGGIGRAVMYEFFRVGSRRGGSTITQQLATNLFFTRERSYLRKLKDILSALKIERHYSKDQIIESYLNSIPYGSNAYGVESAANIFFAKSGKDLTLTECAILAALPNAPSRYSPYGQYRYSSIKADIATLSERNIESEDDLNPEEITRGLLGKVNPVGEEDSIYVRGRVDLILRRMFELNMITEEEKQQAWEESQDIEFQKYREKISAPHFVMYVKQLLEDRYGKDFLEKGGLKVYTTLDPKLQTEAERIVEERGEKNESTYGVGNASLVSMDAKNWQIVAMVGARDYFDTENDGNVNVSLKYRLPGSSFKPFAYAAAFLNGYAPGTVVYDLQTDFGGGYKPKNFDGTYSGPVSFRRALGHSLNVPAIKAGYLGEIPNVIKLVRKMGIDLPQDESWYGLSLALGAGEVRLIDMVGAYGAFANNGKKREMKAIMKIVDHDGNILEEWSLPDDEEVIDAQAAYLITHVLSDQGSRGPGFNKYLQIAGHVIASKTGTSNKKIGEKTVPSDAWTMGYTRHYVTGVWSGNNDGSALNNNAAGLLVAGPIYHEFMTIAHEEKEKEEFEVPDGIRRVQISTVTGKLPTKNTPSDKIRSELFASFNVPTEVDDSAIELEIDQVTGLLASDECPEEARIKKVFVSYHSIKPDLKNWEIPVMSWAKKNMEETGAAPTEKCTISEDDPRLAKPAITIESPVNDGNVSAPGVGIWVDIISSNKVAKVEYYFDGELIDTQTKAPYKGTIPISKELENGSTHIIVAKVVDEYFSYDQHTIEVKVGDDNTKPEVDIVYPEEGAELSTGSTVTARVEVRDDRGDIDYVTYTLNGDSLATKLTFPYSVTFSLPEEAGEHTLKATAYDKAGNEASNSISFSTTSSSASSDYSIDILSPDTDSTFTFGHVVPMRIFASPEMLGNIEKIEVMDGYEPIESITSFEGNESGIIDIAIGNLRLGEHELYLKSTDKDNKMKHSRRVNIIIEE